MHNKFWKQNVIFALLILKASKHKFWTDKNATNVNQYNRFTSFPKNNLGSIAKMKRGGLHFSKHK